MKNKSLKHLVIGILVPLVPVLCACAALLQVPESGAGDILMNPSSHLLALTYGAMLLGIPCGAIGIAYLNKHLKETASYALVGKILCILDFIVAIILIVFRLLLL